MNMSAKELKDIIKRNPGLMVQTAGNAQPVLASSLISGSAKNKEPKYHNKKVYVYEDGMVSGSKELKNHGGITEVFDSTREYQRWHELQLIQKAGRISDLTRQAALTIQEAFKYHGTHVRSIIYQADFMYKRPNGDVVVEDVKGLDSKTQRHITTEKFLLKWKLLKARYPEYYFEIF